MSDSIWFRRGLRVVSLGCLAAAVGLLGSVVLMATGGGVWAFIFYADTPLENLAQGFVCLLMWQLLRSDLESLKTWPKVLAKTILLLVSVGLTFLMGEVFLRAVLYSRQQSNSLDAMRGGKRVNTSSHTDRADSPLGAIVEPSSLPGVQYSLQSGISMVFGNKWLQTNNDAMRESRDYPVEKGSNVVRIVGIGDSGMFGWGLAQGRDYMSVLETNLNARGDGRQYDVLNFGTPGYNTELEVATLKARGLKYRPDVVLVGWCLNDWFLPYFLLKKENYTRKDVSFLYTLLFQRPQFIRLTGGGLSDPRAQDAEVGKDFTLEKGLKSVRDALITLKRLGEENGFHILVFGPLRDDIRGLVSDLGIPHCDTYTAIPEGSVPAEWEVHFMHPREEGHRALGELLAKELQSRGWI